MSTIRASNSGSNTTRGINPTRWTIGEKERIINCTRNRFKVRFGISGGTVPGSQVWRPSQIHSFQRGKKGVAHIRGHLTGGATAPPDPSRWGACGPPDPPLKDLGARWASYQGGYRPPGPPRWGACGPPDAPAQGSGGLPPPDPRQPLRGSGGASPQNRRGSGGRQDPGRRECGGGGSPRRGSGGR